MSSNCNTITAIKMSSKIYLLEGIRTKTQLKSKQFKVWKHSDQNHTLTSNVQCAPDFQKDKQNAHK